MSDEILAQARRLEELLPDALRTLFSLVEGDPLAELPVGQIRLMRLLFRRDHSPGELACALKISPQAVAQVLTKLERGGYVEGKCLEHDRRCKQVRLTEHGAKAMAERHRARAERAALTLRQMPDAQREALIEALTNLVGIKTQTETLSD